METILRLAQQLADGAIEVQAVIADATLTAEDRRNVFAIAAYILQQRAARPAQRRGCRLLRSLLSPAQRVQYRRRRTFTVHGSAGGRYRLHPATGGVWRLEQHGRYDIGVVSYCLHDPERQVPPADETVGHLLLLRADEPAFLALANARDRPHMGWDGDWHHRLRAARDRRLGAAA